MRPLVSTTVTGLLARVRLATPSSGHSGRRGSREPRREMTSCRKYVALGAAVVSLAAMAPVAIGAANVNNTFACYSRGQTDPGVWETSNPNVFTTDDYAKGYWRPWAVTQKLSSTQIGGFYLTCTLPTGMAALGTYLTDGGDILNANAANSDGKLLMNLYPIAGPVGSGPALVGRFGFDANGNGACGPPAVNFTIALTQNGQPVSSLTPGTYWLTVTDHCANHNFELRSCPGSTSACDQNSVGTEEQITSMNETPGTVTMKLDLVPGTYRLLCDALTAAGVSHEIAFNMYADFKVVGAG